MRFSVFLLLALVACPKRGDLGSLVPADHRPSFNPDDPARMAVVADVRGESGLVLDCFDRYGPAGNTCEVPACDQAPCPTLQVLSVAAVAFAEGPVELPYGVVEVGWTTDDPCALEVGTPVDAAPRVWSPGRVLTRVEPSGFVLSGGAAPTSAWAIDLDGDGDLEQIVEGVRADGGTVTVAFVDGAEVLVAEDVRVEVAEGADEQAQISAELQRSSASVWGLTDAGLDGVLELVTEGEMYEGWWSAVLGVETGAVVVHGSGGCSL